MSYVASASRYDAMEYRRTGRSACCSRPSRSACGTTSGATAPSTRSERSSAGPSISATAGRVAP